MRTSFQMTFRTRVILTLLLVSLVPITAIYFSIHFITARTLVKSGHGMLEDLATALSGEIMLIANTQVAQVKVLATHPVFLSRQEGVEALYEEMESFLASASYFFPDIAVLDLNGNVLYSTGQAYYSSRESSAPFREALEGRIGASRPHLTVGHDGLVYNLFYPVRDQETGVAYVLKLQAPFAQVGDLLGSLHLGANGIVILMDSAGSILFHPQPGRELTRVEDSLIPQSGDTWRGEVRLEDGIDYLAVRAVIPTGDFSGSSDWHLVLLRPRSEIIAAIDDAKIIIWATAAVTLLAAFLIGVLLVRHFTRPIQRTAKLAARVAGGDLSVVFPTRVDAEMAAVGTALNRMIEEVRRRRADLEERVEERTRALTESEQRSLALFEGMTNAACYCQTETNLQGELSGCRIVDVNPAFQQLLALPDGGAEDMDFADLFPVETWIDAIRRVAECGESCTFELRHPGTGSELYCSAFPLDPAKPSSFCITAFDLTEKKRAEERLRHGEKMEAVGRLAGGIAHDFNNLLQILISSTDLLDLTNGNESNKTILNEMESAIERACKLVRQLMTFARRDHKQIESRPIDLSSLVEEFASMLRRLLGSHIELVVEPAREIIKVSVDPGQIETALVNLCVNSRDAMPDGGTIRIGFSNLPADGERPARVRITVADNGPGIPAEMQRFIFEPFFTTKAIGKGTGLGLATVYGIVSRHGGWISLDTESPGTVFHIEIPAAEKEEVETAQETGTAASDRAYAEEKPLTGLRILLAEDETVIRQLAVKILNLAGAGVVEAADGEQAVEIFRNEVKAGGSFDIAVLDILMPGKGGHAACLELHGMIPDFPVLFCSGYSAPQHREDLAVGTIDERMLQKPYRPAKLIAAILETLRMNTSV